MATADCFVARVTARDAPIRSITMNRRQMTALGIGDNGDDLLNKCFFIISIKFQKVIHRTYYYAT